MRLVIRRKHSLTHATTPEEAEDYLHPRGAMLDPSLGEILGAKLDNAVEELKKLRDVLKDILKAIRKDTP